MTGKRKNEHIDIVSQAQSIVDEYEEKYFKCLGDALSRERRNKKRRRVVLAFFAISLIAFGVFVKIFIA